MSQKVPFNTTARELRSSGRIALCLAYNGSQYHGWQLQKDGLPTVQESLEKAVSKVANESIEVVCAGRTDSSVHSSYQVVHFDTSAQRDPRAWVFGCNANLPKDISVSWAGKVNDDFHARFSATSRRYNYVIYNHPIRPANFSTELTWNHHLLDEKKMYKAAQCLVGEHDFTSFRASACQSKTPFRCLEFVNVKRYGDIVLIDIKGNAFLHHMVRNIAGSLMVVGQALQPVSWIKEVLDAKNRCVAGITGPSAGLYFVDVDYPNEFDLPKSKLGPLFLD